MTPTELADAIDAKCNAYPRDVRRVLVEVDTLRDAARQLRTLHAMLLDTGRSLALLTEALERVGGGQ